VAITWYPRVAPAPRSMTISTRSPFTEQTYPAYHRIYPSRLLLGWAAFSQLIRLAWDVTRVGYSDTALAVAGGPGEGETW
jgi:hypothetical protein